MHRYSVFGSCLRSAIEFPELRASRDPEPRWTLRATDAPAALGRAELLGTDAAIPSAAVSLYKFAGGYRLQYPDTGSFDVSPDGRCIDWSSPPTCSLPAARLDVISQVLPLALYASGMLCLHGSAVALEGGDGAIGFLAPSFYGKSTLAMAMVRAAVGARILTDDALPVEPRAPITAWPGVHSVRLWDDAVRRIIGDGELESVGAYQLERRDGKAWPTEPFRGTSVTSKQILSRLPEDKLMLARTTLKAIYLLAPAQAGTNSPAARRTLLPAVRAALSLVQHAKLGALLGKSEAPVLFDRAVRVAAAVPVYELAIVRDLDRIPEVVAQLTDWHEVHTRAGSVEVPVP
jgi:hypothetical protein